MYDPYSHCPPSPPPDHDPLAGVVGILVAIIAYVGIVFLGIKGILPDEPLMAFVPAGLIGMFAGGVFKNIRSGDDKLD